MRDEGVEHRALKVAAVSGLSSITSIGLQVATVPICLYYWGKEGYGVWLGVLAFFGLLQSTGTGFVNYIGNKINILYHRDSLALQKTLASSIAGVIVLGCVQIGIAVLVIEFELLPGLMGVNLTSLEDKHIGQAVMILTASWVVGGLFWGIIHRLMIPARLMYQAGWWALANQIGLGIAVIAAAAFEASVVWASILFSSVQSIFALSAARYVHYKLPEYSPWWSGFDSKRGLRDLVHSIPLTISGIGQQATNSGVVVLLSGIAGAAAIPIFTTVRTLSNLWTTVAGVLTAPLLPDVVRFYALRQRRKIVATQEVHWTLVGSLINLSLIVAFPLIEPLFGLWTGHIVALDPVLLCSLLASVSVTTFGGVISTYLNGINHSKALLTASVARGVVTLFVAGWIIHQIGLGGLGVGVAAGELVAVVVGVWFVRRATYSRHMASRLIQKSAPPLVSVGAVLTYLTSEAMGMQGAPVMQVLAVSVVLISGMLGWRDMDPTVKRRLVRLMLPG